MPTIAEYAQHELEWTQPSAGQMRYELRAGDQVIAGLQFRSMWGSLATAESDDGCWTFGIWL